MRRGERRKKGEEDGVYSAWMTRVSRMVRREVERGEQRH